MYGIFGIFFIEMIVQHELLHQIIFSAYNVDSKVTYNFWNGFLDSLKFKLTKDLDETQPWAWTTPDKNSVGNCTESCEVLHAQIEISDAQTQTIVATLFFMLLLYLFYNQLKEKEYSSERIYYEDEYPRFEIGVNENHQNHHHQKDL